MLAVKQWLSTERANSDSKVVSKVKAPVRAISFDCPHMR